MAEALLEAYRWRLKNVILLAKNTNLMSPNVLIIFSTTVSTCPLLLAVSQRQISAML